MTVALRQKGKGGRWAEQLAEENESVVFSPHQRRTDSGGDAVEKAQDGDADKDRSHS